LDRAKFERYFKAVENLFYKIKGEGKVILDAGCGFGLISIIFSTLGAKEVIAIDFSETEIAGFKKILSKLPSIDNLKVYRMDVVKTDFSDNNFDIIFASDAISHIYDLEKFLIEAKRLLKNNGTFYVYESNNIFSITRRLFLKRYWRKVEYGPFDPQLNLYKPFSQLRREIIRESFPSLDERVVDSLVKATQGMVKNEIISAVNKFLKGRPVERKSGFKYIDPRSGMLAELPINIFSLNAKLKKIGFKTKILAPYFHYTYPYLSYPMSKIARQIFLKPL
jgi:Methylase involved in ubiquinone/menaquinone biosynthesis